MIRSTLAAPPALSSLPRVPDLPSAAQGRSVAGGQHSFAASLFAAGEAGATASETDAEVLPRADARASAETLVAQTFIAPLLAQLRETNKAAGPFGVSEAEKRLGPVFDERIATQVVRQARLPIVDQVEASLLRSQKAAAAAAAAKEAAP